MCAFRASLDKHSVSVSDCLLDGRDHCWPLPSGTICLLRFTGPTVDLFGSKVFHLSTLLSPGSAPFFHGGVVFVTDYLISNAMWITRFVENYANSFGELIVYATVLFYYELIDVALVRQLLFVYSD